jgi:hypothetical protein
MMRTSFASTSTRDASQHLSSLRFDIADNRVGVMPAK